MKGKYSPEDRMEIGRQIYTGEISRYAAAAKYGVDPDTARTYMRYYRDFHNLPPKFPSQDEAAKKFREEKKAKAEEAAEKSRPKIMRSGQINTYFKKDKASLIKQLAEARINEARLKIKLQGDPIKSSAEESYRIIAELFKDFPVRYIAEMLNVKPSAFYSWHSGLKQKAKENGTGENKTEEKPLKENAPEESKTADNEAENDKVEDNKTEKDKSKRDAVEKKKAGKDKAKKGKAEKKKAGTKKAEKSKKSPAKKK